MGNRAHELLGGRHGLGTVLQQLRHEHLGGFVEPVPRTHLVNQAELDGGACIEAFGAQKQSARLTRANGFDDERADGGGNETELDLR